MKIALEPIRVYFRYLLSFLGILSLLTCHLLGYGQDIPRGYIVFTDITLIVNFFGSFILFFVLIVFAHRMIFLVFISMLKFISSLIIISIKDLDSGLILKKRIHLYRFFRTGGRYSRVIYSFIYLISLILLFIAGYCGNSKFDFSTYFVITSIISFCAFFQAENIISIIEDYNNGYVDDNKIFKILPLVLVFLSFNSVFMGKERKNWAIESSKITIFFKNNSLEDDLNSLFYEKRRIEASLIATTGSGYLIYDQKIRKYELVSKHSVEKISLN